MRHLIPISGKDSLCTALLQTESEPEHDYEYLFNDVGMELPETYAWLTRVQKTLGKPVKRIGRSLESIMEHKNQLPSHNRRFCTTSGKIMPMREWVGKDEAVLYVGIRSDEDDRAGKFVETENIKVRFPLREHGYELNDVYKLLDSRGLAPPSFFWQRLYDAVLPKLAEVSVKFVERLPKWQIHRLFSWRSRSNCFMCFYQRMYEWVGLLEFHPDLFERAEKLEEKYGSVEGDSFGTRTKLYTLRPDGPLKRLRTTAREYVFNKRVEQVRDMIVKFRTNPDDDPMGLTSCGVYCGK